MHYMAKALFRRFPIPGISTFSVKARHFRICSPMIFIALLSSAIGTQRQPQALYKLLQGIDFQLADKSVLETYHMASWLQSTIGVINLKVAKRLDLNSSHHKKEMMIMYRDRGVS